LLLSLVVVVWFVQETLQGSAPSALSLAKEFDWGKVSLTAVWV
jgi:hypothetical protein